MFPPRAGGRVWPSRDCSPRHGLRSLRTVPQRLKPINRNALFGTAKPVPFRSLHFSAACADSFPQSPWPYLGPDAGSSSTSGRRGTGLAVPKSASPGETALAAEVRLSRLGANAELSATSGRKGRRLAMTGCRIFLYQRTEGHGFSRAEKGIPIDRL